jgi:hypothetical protein
MKVSAADCSYSLESGFESQNAVCAFKNTLTEPKHLLPERHRPQSIKCPFFAKKHDTRKTPKTSDLPP